MKVYQVVNEYYNAVPVKPFDDLDAAKHHILMLLETYNGPFHVVALDVVHTQVK